MTNNVVYVDRDFEDVLPQFMDIKRREIEKIKLMIKEDDYEGISAIAHKLKGACAVYGFKVISELSREMESYCMINDMNMIQETVVSIEKFLDEAEVVFVDL